MRSRNDAAIVDPIDVFLNNNISNDHKNINKNVSFTQTHTHTQMNE